MSRWWAVLALVLVLIAAYANGFTNLVTWGLVFFGALFGLALVLVFPNYWLSRRD